MTDKQQIEKFAKDLCKACRKSLKTCECKTPCVKAQIVSEALYNARYRKVDENAVVLSREELSKRDYEFRQIGYDECLRDNPKKDIYIKALERKIDQLNAKLDQARKGTAKEIFTKLIEVARNNDNKLSIGLLKAWAIEYGVGVEDV